MYVVGVDPAEQGSGLGRALTLAGLHYLRDRGLSSVILYVEGDNAPARHVYTALGFTHDSTDAMYQHPADPTTPNTRPNSDQADNRCQSTTQ